MPKKVQSFGTADVKCKSNNPTHPVNGPGRIGKKAPIKPKQIQRNPKKSKSMSINLVIARIKIIRGNLFLRLLRHTSLSTDRQARNDDLYCTTKIQKVCYYSFCPFLTK